jgi:hypothetical protein
MNLNPGEREAMERIAEERYKRLEEALKEALVPLAVMKHLNDDWRHPILRQWWRRLVSANLRRQINVGHDAARSALAEQPENTTKERTT